MKTNLSFNSNSSLSSKEPVSALDLTVQLYLSKLPKTIKSTSLISCPKRVAVYSGQIDPSFRAN
jgi:hypothetical protein